MADRPCPHRDDEACAICEYLELSRAEVKRLRGKVERLQEENARLRQANDHWWRAFGPGGTGHL